MVAGTAAAKVAGLERPTELLTKHLTQERIELYSDLIGYTRVWGRASLTSGLHFFKNNTFCYASVGVAL